MTFGFIGLRRACDNFRRETAVPARETIEIEDDNRGVIRKGFAQAGLALAPFERDWLRRPGPNFAMLFRFFAEARQPSKGFHVGLSH
jgi:hypothetical protein